MTVNLAANWDTHWKWDWFKNNGWNPPNFRTGYAGLSCQYYDRILKTYGCQKVLDCACGCGPKSIILAELGYQVTGADISPFAVGKAQELAQRLGQNIPFYVVSWNKIADHLAGPFDAIVNDALAWSATWEDLSSVCDSLGKVLKPGGIVLFSGADEWNGRGSEAKNRCRDAAAKTLVPYALQGPYQNGTVKMSQVIIKRLEADYIEVTNLYVVEEHGRITLEYDCLQESFKWGWEDLSKAFTAANFFSLQSHRVTVGNKERIFNVAVR